MEEKESIHPENAEGTPKRDTTHEEEAFALALGIISCLLALKASSYLGLLPQIKALPFSGFAIKVLSLIDMCWTMALATGAIVVGVRKLSYCQSHGTFDGILKGALITDIIGVALGGLFLWLSFLNFCLILFSR
jgi:hypothetical protein